MSIKSEKLKAEKSGRLIVASSQESAEFTLGVDVRTLQRWSKKSPIEGLTVTSLSGLWPTIRLEADGATVANCVVKDSLVRNDRHVRKYNKVPKHIINQSTLKEKKSLHQSYQLLILIIVITCICVCIKTEDNCNERVKNERFKAGFELAKFCGKVSKENERDFIIIKPK